MYKISALQFRDSEGFKLAPPQVGADVPLSEGLRVYFACLRGRPVTEKDALDELRKKLAAHPLPWLVPGPDTWSVDLDQLVQQLPASKLADRPAWLSGTAAIRPLFESGVPDLDKHPPTWRGYTCFDMTEEALRTPMGIGHIPAELRDSLRSFMSDYPSTTKTAFIMMRFGRSPAHRKITGAIKKALAPFNIVALRADDKEYHPDLFSNVLTYIYGCRFGIAVFERIESDEFNPNVSLEVGYMMAISKPVCFLKDATLRALPADLIGRLYRSFDPQKPATSIPRELKKWCEDRELI
jgi:hypothetical protein